MLWALSQKVYLKGRELKSSSSCNKFSEGNVKPCVILLKRRWGLRITGGELRIVFKGFELPFLSLKRYKKLSYTLHSSAGILIEVYVFVFSILAI
jgi:hypothetical protein